MIFRTVEWINLLTANNKRWHQALYAKTWQIIVNKPRRGSGDNNDRWDVFSVGAESTTCCACFAATLAAFFSHVKLSIRSCLFFHSLSPFIIVIYARFVSTNNFQHAIARQMWIIDALKMSGTSCFYLIRKIAAMLTFFIEWTVCWRLSLSPARCKQFNWDH